MSTLNLPLFIAKRINTKNSNQGFSSAVQGIAIVSVGIGLAAIIISFLIMKGFQETVKEKIFGFSGHLLVTKYSNNTSFEEEPFHYGPEVFRWASEFPKIRHVQEYAHKTALIKTKEDVLGVVLKGVGKSFDSLKFSENMLEGHFISFPDSGYSSQVLLSKVIANKLGISVGHAFNLHFFQDPPRVRRVKVVGVYETNLSEYFDNKVIIGDIRLIQRMNNWADSIAGGLEIFLEEEGDADLAEGFINSRLAYDQAVEKIRDRYIQVFEWLNLLNKQVDILLGIILVVISVNIVSIILILVMERTSMIGTLQALGADHGLIRSVFLVRGISLAIKGLLVGNILGLGLCFLQHRFHIVTLNPHDYYMRVVPVSWHWEIVGILNLLTFFIIFLVLFIPTSLLSKIRPIRAIRFA